MVKNFQSGLLVGIVLTSICCGSAIIPSPVNPTTPPTSYDDLRSCNLPAEAGPCRALFPRHYFNLETGQCNVFTYGGCLGNANNFVTSEECQAFGRKCLRDFKGPKTGRPRRYHRSVGNTARFLRSSWKS